MAFVTILDIIQCGLFFGTVITLASPWIPGLRSVSRYGKTLKVAQRVNIYLPKRYFTHFYVVATVLPVILVMLLLSDIPVVEWLANNAWFSREDQRTLSKAKAMFVLLLNLLQGSRRLYESMHVFRSSPVAKIQAFHYLVGLAFYVIVDVQLVLGTDPFDRSPLPLIKSGVFALCFFIIYLDQARNHVHLSGLKKYTIPTQGLFHYVAGAHYFDEIALYTMMALYLETRTSMAVALYVTVSLSAVARNSYEFYCEKDSNYGSTHRVVVPLVY